MQYRCRSTGQNPDVYTVFRNLLFSHHSKPLDCLGHELKTKLLTPKPSFLSKILSLAHMGEGRLWIRLGWVKTGYLVHFALAQA
jgi:hypothetical protein